MVLIVRTLRGNTLYHSPPDGGWAWIVLVSAFFMNFLIFSMTRCFGIFYNDFISEFEASNSQISLISSIATAMIGLAAPLGSVIARKFDARKVMLVAACLCGTGLIVSAFSSVLWTVHLGIGVVWGCGCCWTYVTCITQINMYFKKWRGIANGIAVSGSSTGSLLLPIFAQYLVTIYDWRGSLIILAGLCLNGCVFAALIRPISSLPTSKIVKCKDLEFVDKVTEAVELKAMDESLEESDLIEIIQKQELSKSGRISKFIRNYWLLMFWGLLEFSTGLCVFGPVIYIVPLAKELGCSSEQAALLLSLTAVGDLIVRPLSGMMISWSGSRFERWVLFCIATVHFMQLFVCFLAIYAEGFQNLISYALLYGCTYGVFVTFESMVTVSLLGVRRIEKYIGFQLFASGIGLLVSPPFAGYLVDTYHTYKAAYWFLMGCYLNAAVLYIIGGACVKKMGGVLVEQRVNRRKRRI